MKTLLLITVCENNLNRFLLQIENIKTNEAILKEKNIFPVFVLGKNNIQTSFPYTTWNLPLEERYTNLYIKIINSFERALLEEFDYLIKIDDDTLFNPKQYNIEEYKDFEYIGRMQKFFTKNQIIIDMPMFNINTKIDIYPKEFKDNFSFATGDFYILKRNIIEYIVSKKEYIEHSFNEEEYVCEDQLIGFLLQKQKVKTLNIDYENRDIQSNSWIQVTKNIMSLHPVNSLLFNSLIKKTPEEQLKALSNDSINSCYRKTLTSNLQKNIIGEVLKFANSKKLMGMG